MTILRVYKPDECDADGNPLDWLACRECKGKGLLASRTPGAQMVHACPSCGGDGSLHAAALSKLWTRMFDATVDPGVRCEDCQHPMSEGTWDGHPNDYYENLEWAEAELRAGCEPDDRDGTYHSRCDDLCNHGGPVRALVEDSPLDEWQEFAEAQLPVALRAPGIKAIEASWRPVDVRRLSWPHDLRPESLACLCLRCWAAR